MPIATEAQFTEVYRAHYEDVLRFVRRRAHPMNVDDVVGETFLAAWRRRREAPEDARPWLFGTARNLMLNANRGMRRQSALVVHIGRTATVDAHDPTDGVDSRLELVEAWQALGCTRASYSMRLTRAKRRLAGQLGRAAVTESSGLSLSTR
ncbi:sigma-70 family RNA polymerase sigma factor [Streptomyces sp. NPDC091219]|uniref:RNA polymerase sigma factor n=1 Tax=Streptomyces sp. NPDC091219 TaxID=3155193 RepID=UPI00344E6942